jgi:hypothetical protein
MEEIGGREKADELAGEIIHWHNEKKLVGEVEGMVPHNVTVKAPLFNLASSQPTVFEFRELIGSNTVG